MSGRGTEGGARRSPWAAAAEIWLAGAPLRRMHLPSVGRSAASLPALAHLTPPSAASAHLPARQRDATTAGPRPPQPPIVTSPFFLSSLPVFLSSCPSQPSTTTTGAARRSSARRGRPGCGTARRRRPTCWAWCARCAHTVCASGLMGTLCCCWACCMAGKGCGMLLLPPRQAPCSHPHTLPCCACWPPARRPARLFPPPASCSVPASQPTPLCCWARPGSCMRGGRRCQVSAAATSALGAWPAAPRCATALLRPAAVPGARSGCGHSGGCLAVRLLCHGCARRAVQ